GSCSRCRRPLCTSTPLFRPSSSRPSAVSESGSSRALHSFPTRRSSDLLMFKKYDLPSALPVLRATSLAREFATALAMSVYPQPGDRKSTRLNSSHVKISYAVFCVKKKKGAEMGRAYVRTPGKKEECLSN